MKIDYAKIEKSFLELKAGEFIRDAQRLGAGHYRINDALDIYPRHKKWHSLPTGKRGVYYDLEDFVKGFFNPELRKERPTPRQSKKKKERWDKVIHQYGHTTILRKPKQPFFPF
jgi:hypothetical protein